MSQVVLIATIGTVAYLGYRAFKALGSGMSAQPVPVRVKATYLERGPDGVYRPTERR